MGLFPQILRMSRVIPNKKYKFLSEHLYLSVLIIFVSTTFAILAAAYLLGILILSSATCPHYAGDPCDAAPMLVMSLWVVSIPVSIITALTATALTVYASRIYIK